MSRAWAVRASGRQLRGSAQLNPAGYGRVLVSLRRMLLALAIALVASTSAADAEVERVRAHLVGAEALLDARDVSALSPAQRAARARARERLRAYREAGLFPHNHDFADRRVPYFIDAHGTRCAMAHLVESAGGGAYVEHVARTRNNATVHELADDPELLAWLEDNGLTLEEAARIQPTYGDTCSSPTWCLCGGNSGNVSVPVVTTAVVVEHVATSTRATVIMSTGALEATFPVGSTIEWPRTDADGRYLVGYGDPESRWAALPIDGQDQVSCDRRVLSLAEAVAAMSSADCRQHLADRDPRWESECPGCSVMGSADASWSLWVLALCWISRRRRAAAAH